MAFNRVLLALALGRAAPAGFSSSDAIGLVAVNGSFQLDHSRVLGTATLFDGNVIGSRNSASHLRLQNGIETAWWARKFRLVR